MNFDGKFFFLMFKLSEFDDEGEYKCVGCNEFGSVLIIVELFVNDVGIKLEFIEKIKNISVLFGEEVRFDVCVVGLFLLEVDWFKGKEKIEDEGCFVLIDDIEDDLFLLVIEDVKLFDSGEYECVVFNEFGEVLCKGNLVVEEIVIVFEVVEDVESVLFLFEDMIIVLEFVEEEESVFVVVEEGVDVSLSVNVKG